MNEFPNDQNPSNGDENEATRNFSQDLLGASEDFLSDEEQTAVDSLPKGNALLIVRRGPNKGARFLLDADLITIGRHPNADIFLDDATVSRRHAEITRSNSDFAISDLVSLNGTYFQGSRVETAQLFDKAEIQVGKYHLTFFSSKKDD